MSQGQGDWTPYKERSFADLFLMTLRISKAESLLPFTYWHVDLNAGCGWNETANCAGSPLVFVRTALLAGRPVRALFLERNADLAARLRQRLEEERLPCWVRWDVYARDNETFPGLVRWAMAEEENRPGLAFGTVLCDPNGIKDGFPVVALAEFMAGHRRMDLILNLNFRVLRCVRGCKASGSEVIRKGFVDWPELQDVLPHFAKDHWFVGNPVPVCGDCFGLLRGSNFDVGRRPFGRMHHVGTEQGRRILRKLGYVDLSPTLWDL
jgi:hypothetical protein